MNEAIYILAQLKRWLVNTKEYMNGKDILAQIAKLEADAILGEEYDPAELPFMATDANPEEEAD